MFADDKRLHRQLLRAIDSDMTLARRMMRSLKNGFEQKDFVGGKKCDQTKR
jgi:hypothetical protein